MPTRHIPKGGRDPLTWSPIRKTKDRPVHVPGQTREQSERARGIKRGDGKAE